MPRGRRVRCLRRLDTGPAREPRDRGDAASRSSACPRVNRPCRFSRRSRSRPRAPPTRPRAPRGTHTASHQREPDGKQNRYRNEDGELRAKGHRALRHVALEHLLVDARPLEPCVQARGAAGEAEGREQDERRRGKDRRRQPTMPSAKNASPAAPHSPPFTFEAPARRGASADSTYSEASTPSAGETCSEPDSCSLITRFLS